MTYQGSLYAGTSTVTVVPLPASDWIVRTPPRSLACSCIPMRPICPPLPGRSSSLAARTSVVPAHNIPKTLRGFFPPELLHLAWAEGLKGKSLPRSIL